MSTEPSTALAAPSLTAPRRCIDDPRELDDAQLLEILQAFHTRTTTIGAVGAAVTAAAAVALTTTAVWFAAIALIPAAIGGFVLSNRVVMHSSAARFGVTPRCLREVELAFDVVSRRLDVRTLEPRDLVRTNWPRMIALVKAELAANRSRAGQ